MGTDGRGFTFQQDQETGGDAGLSAPTADSTAAAAERAQRPQLWGAPGMGRPRQQAETPRPMWAGVSSTVSVTGRDAQAPEKGGMKSGAAKPAGAREAPDLRRKAGGEGGRRGQPPARRGRRQERPRGQHSGGPAARRRLAGSTSGSPPESAHLERGGTGSSGRSTRRGGTEGDRKWKARPGTGG